MADELFNDGVANAGSVFRRGDEVIRPAGPHSIAVHSLLKHLRAVGFTGAPAAIAIEDATERVSYISGEVPAPPYTAWSLSDDNIYKIAGLQRAYHDAVRTFVPPPHSFWNTSLADPEGKGIIAHNDMGPGNIVFRNETPVGFIDFDFAAPGRALWDVARAARTWVPLDNPDCAATYGLGGLNPLSRFKVFCDGYGLDRKERNDLVDLLNLCNAVSEAFVRQEYNAGKPAFVRMWNEYRLDELYAKRREWIKSNIENLRAAAM